MPQPERVNMIEPTRATQSESPRPARKRAAWLVPGSLLVLFVVTALASRWIDKGSSRSPGGNVVDPPARPVQGGVFRFPLQRPLRTLDPAQAVFTEDVMIVQQLYDGLTAFDRHLNVVPALARFWEISPDGRIYTFELRDDARFHNGRAVTAEDCVYSFERLLTRGLNEHNYHYFSRIEGAEAFRSGRAAHVRGLEALDEKTIRIRFETPFVPALSVLSMYSSKILPKKELLEMGDAFFKAPIGTGAFQFARWIEPPEDSAVPVFDGVRQGLRLEANLQYFDGRPHLDAVVFRAIWNAAEFENEWRPLQEVADLIGTIDVHSYADWVAVEANQLLALRYLSFPNHVAPFDNPKVRLAINYALDKRSFLDANRTTAGIPPATGVVPPGIPGFIPKGSLFGQDVERARELLVEAGYPDGKGIPPLELPVLPHRSDSNDPAAIARSCLVACLARVGVEVRLVEVESMGFDARRYEDRAMLRPGNWFADFPDPDNFLRTLFHSHGYMNTFGYRNPDVDRLLERVWSETSYTERNKLYHQIEKLVLKDSPIIPTDYGRLRYLMRPNVRGFHLSPLGAPYVRFKDIWLAEEGSEAGVEL